MSTLSSTMRLSSNERVKRFQCSTVHGGEGEPSPSGVFGVASESGGADGVEIVDITNPNSPNTLTTIDAEPGPYEAIHNVSYQGRFPETQWPLLSLPRSYYTHDFEFFGQINLTKLCIHQILSSYFSIREKK